MKSIYLAITAILCTSVSFAQLFIKDTPTSDSVYVYVKDQVLFVNQDIELDGANDSGNIYLREEGQLIQGEGANQINRGAGIVSVYQEGTTNEYDYNYWCPPISEASSVVDGNTVFGYEFLFDVDDRTRSTGVVTSTDYTSYAADPLILSTYWLWTFRGGTEYSNWVHIDNTKNLIAGEGITMKGVRGVDLSGGIGQRYDFRGRPNNGTIDVNINADEFALVGNPYPSAMDLDYYLLYNSGEPDLSGCGDGTLTAKNVITGEALFWESDPNAQSHNLVEYVGGYGIYMPMDCSTMGTYAPATFYTYNGNGEQNSGSGTTAPLGVYGRRFAPIGQGFMVTGATGAPSGSQVTARNAFRVYEKETGNDDSTFKEAAPDASKKSSRIAGPRQLGRDQKTGKNIVPQFNLDINIDDLYTRSLVKGFYEMSSIYADSRMDGKAPGQLDTDAFFPIEEEAYVINISPFDEDGAIPLTLVSEKETLFDIKISSINFDIAEIYLHDKQRDIYTDILHSSSEFRLPAGEFKNRFEIVFKDPSNETLAVAGQIKDSFTVFQNNRASQLEIINPDSEDMKSISLYDTAGRKVFTKNGIGTRENYSISTINMSDGIYIAKITTAENVEITKKVSIRNLK